MKKIYFVASFGNFNKLPLGGGQTAARRLLTTLQNLGYDVTPIKRHPPTARHKFFRAFQFGFWMCVDPILLFCRLILKSRENTLTLYMGFLGRILIPLEFMMSGITHLLGYKNLLYLAGGGTEKMYQQSWAIMRYLERRILKNYRLVMVEGLENIDFVKKRSNSETFYLPNFTENGFAPSVLPLKPSNKWNLIYFGRITEVKNVLLCIEIFNSLCNKYNNVTLTIVGGGDVYYCKLLEEKIASSPNRDKITRIGRSSHDELKRILIEQHFFLFPSNEPREGHSNALNEAMSFGIVPVVSNNNFLPSIVGNNRLVAKIIVADIYTQIITDVIESGDYESLSREMFERVQQNFTQSVVEKKLQEAIESI